ncbi:hypothetical protein EYF80_062330 [Liparis tanakae]|uniref:Uncharacterized protein n=1 Tax=Liparis tanakae TaxID=230148 RepID=A0A4Z2EFM9_9TELE|nr:hypothetical protein EYF80_062330 [Liparis tanakae]
MEMKRSLMATDLLTPPTIHSVSPVTRPSQWNLPEEKLGFPKTQLVEITSGSAAYRLGLASRPPTGRDADEPVRDQSRGPRPAGPLQLHRLSPPGPVMPRLTCSAGLLWNSCRNTGRAEAEGPERGDPANTIYKDSKLSLGGGGGGGGGGGRGGGGGGRGGKGRRGGGEEEEEEEERRRWKRRRWRRRGARGGGEEEEVVGEEEEEEEEEVEEEEEEKEEEEEVEEKRRKRRRRGGVSSFRPKIPSRYSNICPGLMGHRWATGVSQLCEPPPPHGPQLLLRGRTKENLLEGSGMNHLSHRSMCTAG